MPVPNSMADLAQLASSNSPAGSEVIGNSLDDYIRAGFAIVRSTNAVSSITISAASTTDIATATGEAVSVTGSATINSLGTGFVGCFREVAFTGACTVVNSTNIVLPGGANIVTAAGHVHAYRCTGSGVWRLVGASMPAVASISGLQSALDLKLNNSGDNTHAGRLNVNPPGTLGSSAGSLLNIFSLNANSGNGDALNFFLFRQTNGTGWGNAALRIERTIDGSANQGFIDFSGNSLNRAVTMGSSGTDLCWIDRSGNFTAIGNLISNSDESLKHNWQAMPEDFVERLAQVKAGVYERKDTGAWQVGVGAQSLEKLLPHAVTQDDVTGLKGVAYGQAALVSAIALAKRVLALEAKQGAR